MKVVEKETETVREVYDITYDGTGYPRFLIYDDDGTWVRRSAKYFVPINEQTTI